MPEDTRTNNLSPRSELMTFIGLSEGTKGYIFMRSPNNTIFTAIQALFDKMFFPKWPNMHRPGYTPVGITPNDLQGEHNIPPDDENEDHGGGLPPLPYRPAGQVPWQHMQPPPQPPVQYPSQSSPQYYPPLPPSTPDSRPSSKGKGRALSPWGGAPVPDDNDIYMSRPMTPPFSQRTTHPPLNDLFPPLPSCSITPTGDDLQDEVRAYRDQPPERLSVGDPRHPRYNSPWTQQQFKCYIAENPIRTPETFQRHMRGRSDEFEQLRNAPRPTTPPGPTSRRH